MPLTPIHVAVSTPKATPLPLVVKLHHRLVAGTLALGDDTGHLVDLSLAAAEGAEPLLRELARALVLGVAEEFDNAALVGGEAVWLCVSFLVGFSSAPAGVDA